MDGNGVNNTTNDDGVSKITLTFKRATFQLEVSGNFLNLDEALAVLAQATRALEDQRRLALAAQLQQQHLENVRVQNIRDSLKVRN